jgi:hypothetical protein
MKETQSPCFDKKKLVEHQIPKPPFNEDSIESYIFSLASNEEQMTALIKLAQSCQTFDEAFTVYTFFPGGSEAQKTVLYKMLSLCTNNEQVEIILFLAPKGSGVKIEAEELLKELNS